MINVGSAGELSLNDVTVAGANLMAAMGIDAATGAKVIDSRVSMHPEAGLKGLWESMPVQVMNELVRLGKVPGEIRLCSGRVFRLLRPMCLDLPFKLVLRDSLPQLDKAYSS